MSETEGGRQIQAVLRCVNVCDCVYNVCVSTRVPEEVPEGLQAGEILGGKDVTVLQLQFTKPNWNH